MALMPLGGSVTYGGLLLRPEAHQEFHRIALLKLGQPGFSQDAFDFWFQRPEFPLIALCKLRDHFSPSSKRRIQHFPIFLGSSQSADWSCGNGPPARPRS